MSDRIMDIFGSPEERMKNVIIRQVEGYLHHKGYIPQAGRRLSECLIPLDVTLEMMFEIEKHLLDRLAFYEKNALELLNSKSFPTIVIDRTDPQNGTVGVSGGNTE